MTMIRMLVATVTASLAAEISLCAVIVYNHRLGWRKWHYNRSIKPAPGTVYTGHACRHLPSAVPWISEDRLLKPHAHGPSLFVCYLYRNPAVTFEWYDSFV